MEKGRKGWIREKQEKEIFIEDYLRILLSMYVCF